MISKIINVLIFLNMSYVYAMDNKQFCNPDVEQSTPNSRFILNTGNDSGTVTDIRTGLMWKHCLEGQYGQLCQGQAIQYPWRNAIKHAKGSVYAGYNNWRLPTIDELEDIVEISCVNPAINTVIFPNNNNLFIWSSTDYITRKYYFAWGIDFYDGADVTDFQVESNTFRLVRNIQ